MGTMRRLTYDVLSRVAEAARERAFSKHGGEMIHLGLFLHQRSISPQAGFRTRVSTEARQIRRDSAIVALALRNGKRFASYLSL